MVIQPDGEKTWFLILSQQGFFWNQAQHFFTYQEKMHPMLLVHDIIDTLCDPYPQSICFKLLRMNNGLDSQSQLILSS